MSQLVDLASGRSLKMGDVIRDHLGREWQVLGWLNDGTVYVCLNEADSAMLALDIDRFGLVITELMQPE